jgi:hypothetical protein
VSVHKGQVLKVTLVRILLKLLRLHFAYSFLPKTLLLDFAWLSD